jgi:hypothetical protein
MIALVAGAAFAAQPVRLTAAQKSAVESAVRGKLKDASSARFWPMHSALRDPGVVYVCGFVSARVQGGFGGRTPYIGRFEGTAFRVMLLGSDDEMKQAVYETCASLGLNLKAQR